MSVTTPPEPVQPSILETVYKDNFVNPLTKLDEYLEEGVIADGEDPSPYLNQAIKTFFDPKLPFGDKINGDTYLIDQLPPSIGEFGQNIAALMFARNFLETNEAKQLIQNETQALGLGDLISSVLKRMEDEPKAFGDVKAVEAIIQKHIDDAEKHGFLHLSDQEQVKIAIARVKTPHKS